MDQLIIKEYSPFSSISHWNAKRQQLNTKGPHPIDLLINSLNNAGRSESIVHSMFARPKRCMLLKSSSPWWQGSILNAASAAHVEETNMNQIWLLQPKVREEIMEEGWDQEKN